MLFAFDEYKWVVIKNSLVWWTYDKDTKILESYGAESIWDIAEKLERDYGQDLWHRFIWLPGSIAGAVYGNAGCFGLETANNFISCEVLDLENGQVSTIHKKDMDFEYRSSILKKEKNYFLISARFDLSKKIEKYHSDVDNIDFRENEQPKWNSCGSFFKNPSREQSAGYLIEQVGLKWYTIWGASFSEKHANFLMHNGQGNYKDMLELIELAQNRVQDEFGISLINEVQIITNNWNMSEKIRLQKYMSQAWICSRRKAEEYIWAWQVYVNGNVADIGQSITADKDIVTLWKWAELQQQKYVYYKYNKPRGIETTCAQRGGQSIIDIVNIKERVFPIGRLDKETTGLIILTNDGRITNYLTHPRYGHEKEYVVETFGPIHDESLETMSQGVKILWKWTKKCKIQRIAAWKFSITLTEWKNRQIRRMVEEVGNKVKKLKRIRIENILLDWLDEWQARHLSNGEKNVLSKKLGIEL